MNRALVLGLVVLLCGCASNPHARKLTPDQQFVEELRSSAAGTLIVAATDADLVTFGHAVCTLLDQGHPPADVAAAIIKDRTFAQLSSADAALAVSGAVRAYCPQHAGEMQAWNGTPTPTTTPPPTTAAPPTTRVSKKRPGK